MISLLALSPLTRDRERERVRSAKPKDRRGWLHLCNGMDPRRDGGMVPSILGMTGALGAIRNEVTILTTTPSRTDLLSLPESIRFLGPEQESDLEGAIRGAEVVHMHGLWQGHTRRGARLARAARVPYIMAAHGMAEPWAMRHKALKKKVYTALVEGGNLRNASCLHALSRPEIGHLRALAPKTPIAFIPNGVSLAPLENLPPRSELEAEHPELKGKFVLLFLSRIHVKKGLDLLAEAFRDIAADYPNVHILLAGTNDGALDIFQSRVRAAGLESRTTWIGHVSGARARQVWSAADAFILPSYSEGFSMAILEALACRLPSVITTACHFPELADAGGGIVVNPDIEGVTAGLRELMERSPDQRADLGRRGRFLVESQYAWEHQAERLASVYQWVQAGGPAPDFIVPPGAIA